MKIRMSYVDYINRVHGCLLGKCIAGAIGASNEGVAPQVNAQYMEAVTQNMPPNDDLDQQVLWLDVLERVGVHFTAADIAEAFAAHCPHAQDLYAPVSDTFDDDWDRDLRVKAIRSEIWACVAPGDPELASELAARAGIPDATNDPVHAEQFFAAAEALAFVEPDLDICFDRALALMPLSAGICCVIEDVRAWCAKASGWRSVRDRIVREYGPPDCANIFWNVGVTLLALHYGNSEFFDTTMVAMKCGFDTDCVCATAGAILGIHHAATGLMSRYDVVDQSYKLGVDVKRRSDRLSDLAEDIARMGRIFGESNRAVEIAGGPHLTPSVQPR
jgi:hypothetical protein